MDFSSQAYRKLVFDLVILAIRCYNVMKTNIPTNRKIQHQTI